MSEEKDLIGAEDLDVESSEAGRAVGGAGSSQQFQTLQGIEEQIFRLESDGYVAEACTTKGTLYVKGNHKVVVPLSPM
jgi:hypothetical protein